MTDKPTDNNRDKRRISKLDINDWHVLVVDDHKDNLSVAEAVLQFHGANVKTAMNGIEGLDALKDFDATLILLDLSMPEMNGWEMLKQLRTKSETANIPIIALTAHVMSGDEEQVMEAGFDGYIPKPFSVATIVVQIQSILEKITSKEKA